MLWGFLSTDTLSSASTSGLGWVVHNMGWLFSLVASGCVLFVIWLAASKFGRIPLGRDDEEPEFKTVSWIAMMFSAGMGIGLMFYGVSEPLSHFVKPPPGTGAAGNPEAVQNAMATTLFHWTLHPWAIYAVVGLAVAYGVFRRGRSLLISSAFAPLLGEKRAAGPAGRVIDMLAIFATLFGSAASLGPRRTADRLGFEIVGGIGKAGNMLLVAIIAVLTVCFILSAVSGVAKGIQWLSNINMVLALALAVFVFLVGPTVFILNLVPTAVGSYFQDLAMMSARTDAAGGDAMQEWLSGWTIFYWAWWVSWTPFVGMFIARISRGRTIRQFVTGVLLVPSVVSLVWFAIFGGAGSTCSAVAPTSPARPARRPRSSAARADAAVDHHLGRGDAAGRDLLRVRCGRRLDRDGHPVRAGHPRTEPQDGHLLGRDHRCRGGRDAPGRRGGRALRAAEHHHRRGAAVPARDGGTGDRAGEGPQQRPAHRPRAPTPWPRWSRPSWPG